MGVQWHRLSKHCPTSPLYFHRFVFPPESLPSSEMGLGTQNRLNQTADLCKEHLRSTYAPQGDLVEDFIIEVEGAGKSKEILKWSQFTNSDRNTESMFSRLDEKFNRWLNGDL